MKKIIGYLTITNFLSFAVATCYFGGDALNGKEENGHFFLASHGKFTEVTEGVFNYSKYHGLSVFFSIGIVMIIHYAGNSERKSD